MKNSNTTNNRKRVALIVILAASITGLAPAFSTSARAQYSINDVSGNYVDLGDGWRFINGGDNHPGSVGSVGLFTFTPATGTFVAEGVIRHNGENLYYTIVQATYTVDANGHGTMTWAQGDKHRDFYIVNGGAELKWTNTDPPSMPVSPGDTASASGTLTKQ